MNGHLPELPTTWRPLRSRVVIAIATVAFLVAMVGLGSGAMPGRDVLTVVDRLSLLLFWVLVTAVFWALARPHVTADEGGLTVVNLVRTRRLEWAEVVGLRFSRHDPWVILDLSDGTTLPVMGIQRSDGARGEREARSLAAVIRAHQPVD